ncbi:YhgE/Pip domain-containing protein [Bacillus songklensis]|uniref:YhgE/Pip domain-containing protein n=1 Tax=Bacillus songklensis TaxID=1069116 RepID=A0ABV8BAD6_9BACI
MRTLKHFFKVKETYMGIIVAIAFQVIFFSVWMTAYDGVNDRLDHLKVSIVNEDKEAGVSITNSLKEHLPFHVTETSSLPSAKKEMNEHVTNMVIHIPSTFTQDIIDKHTTNLTFYINQSTTSLTKQMMETAAKQMTDEVNHQLFVMSKEKLQTILPAQLSTTSKIPEQMTTGMVGSVLQVVSDQSVQADIIKTNDVNGFSPNMIPLMAVLASFVGAMIMSMQLEMASSKIKHLHSKWSIFFSRQLINILTSLVLSVLTLILLTSFHIELHESLFISWGFQFLVFLTFISLTQMFVMLFGLGGMLFNVIIMASQLVSSGVIVPRELLPIFYQQLGDMLPATYAANGYFSIIFGGGEMTQNVTAMLIILAIVLATATVRQAFPSLQKHHQLEPQTEQ